MVDETDDQPIKKEIEAAAVKITTACLDEHHQKESTPVPKHLYHYTSADGLLGILSSTSVWLTNIQYMNDLSEIQYAANLFQSVLDELDLQQLCPDQVEVVKRLSAIHDGTTVMPDTGIYSASFCENGNLLSQWRAYRDTSGGYALVFDFFHFLRTSSTPCALVKVIYDPELQYKILKGMLESFLSAIPKFTDSYGAKYTEHILLNICHQCSTTATNLFACLKHPEFHEEKEWRLIASAPATHKKYAPNYSLKFRTYNGNLIPYIILDLKEYIDRSNDDELNYPFLFTNLVVGPTISHEFNSRSASILLQQLGPRVDARVSASGIPLRWL